MKISGIYLLYKYCSLFANFSTSLLSKKTIFYLKAAFYLELKLLQVCIINHLEGLQPTFCMVTKEMHYGFHKWYILCFYIGNIEILDEIN